MAKLVSMKVEGLGKFKSALNAYKKQMKADTDAALMKSVQSIGMVARANCKAQSIASTISSGKNESGGYQVTTNGVISVYLEFGTGNYAKTLLGNYPQDWKDMAMKFYINGLGRMPAQPYLYPAFQQGKEALLTNIKQEIEGH